MKDLSDKLQLPHVLCKWTISGIGGYKRLVDVAVEVFLRSRFSNFCLVTGCEVLNEIKQFCPCNYFDRNILTWPSFVKLADPSFNVPSKIACLLRNKVRLSIRWSFRSGSQTKSLFFYLSFSHI